MENLVLGRQRYKCNNCPNSNLENLEHYNCPLWLVNNESRGSFDESGYEITTINETGDKDDNNNLQALCIMCHKVKTLYCQAMENKKIVQNEFIEPIEIFSALYNNIIFSTTYLDKVDKLYDQKTFDKCFNKYFECLIKNYTTANILAFLKKSNNKLVYLDSIDWYWENDVIEKNDVKYYYSNCLVKLDKKINDIPSFLTSKLGIDLSKFSETILKLLNNDMFERFSKIMK